MSREIGTLTGEERDATINAIAEELGRVMRRHLDECTKCCPNCEHWVNGPLTAPIEVCGLADARPPASIIAHGCEKYQDKTPF
jgi:hypothetical protein